MCSSVVVVVLGGALACVPTPPSDDAGPGEARTGPIDFLRMVHDRPAVGGDWYDYDEAGGHIIAPLPQVYVLREGHDEGARYAALRVVSYYDPDTADSGRFTIALRAYDGAAWLPETEWLTSRSVKDGGPLCLDLFSKSEPDCASALWQVQLRATRWLALEGPIVVARPSLQVRSAHGLAGAGDVVIATLAERPSLSGLPQPTSIEDLDDGRQSSWSSSEWDRARYAPDLPERGMAVGARFVDDGFVGNGDVWALLNARRSLVRFQVRPASDGDPDAGLVFTFNKVAVDISDDTIPLEVPASRDVSVPVPGVGARTYLSFEADDLVTEAGAGLHDVPAENQWDLAVVRADDGVVRLVVSAGAAVYNLTRRDGAATFTDAVLPERTTP